MVLVAVHLALAALFIPAAAVIAAVAYHRTDRRVFGVTYGDEELTDQVFTR